MNSLSLGPLPMWALPGLGLLILLALMTWLWRMHFRLRNAAVVDVGWAAGLGLLVLLYAGLGSAPWERRLLLLMLVGTWSFRLAWHLYRDRVAGGTPEEGRYVALREYWGEKAGHYFLYFFLGQGALNILLGIPFLWVAENQGGIFHITEIAAAGLWIFAILGESLSDAQLKAFKAKPENKGKVCDVGLWRYSRHPNYFCEWLIWCAYALLAWSAPYGFVAWISPAVILLLLFKFSGIPPTEKQSLRSRGEAYRRYQARTSAFFPWFPRTEVKIGKVA